MLSFNLGTTNPLGGASTSTTGSTLGTGTLGGTSTTAQAPTSILGGGTGTLGLSAQPAQPQQPQQPQSQSTLTFRVLEDYLNKWMGELDLQETDFLNQATQLNALDKLMIDNGEKVNKTRPSRDSWRLLVHFGCLCFSDSRVEQ